MRKLFLSCALALASVTMAQTTDVVYLSGHGSDDVVEWDFLCTGGRRSNEWTKIKVPSCWEMEGFGTFNYGHDKNKGDESGLYKKTFTLKPEWKGKRLFIVFDGSMTDTEVKVNGKLVGDIHQGSFYRFKYEITKFVKPGQDNLLEVKVNKMSANETVNEAERKCDFWVFGGLFRPVFLEAVPSDFIEYTAIDARHDGKLHVDVFMDKKYSGAEAEVEIRTLDGKTVGSISGTQGKAKSSCITAEGSIVGVKPWSAEQPNLYTAVITVKRNGRTLHQVTDRIGFRTIEVVPHDGIYVNGAKMRFRGVDRHSHYPTTGRTTNHQLSVSDVKLMQEMNMNAVRMSHYPPDKHFLEVCDSLGMYVIDELCAWQYPPYDTPTGTKLVGEMLKRDLNRPCVVIWSNGNEGGFNYDLDPLFPQYDPQKRAVIHPFALNDHINTSHYVPYDDGIATMFHGRDIFMPTENIHGLYDGGHGASLDDMWRLMMGHPLSAGMFLWDFCDQATIRADKGGFFDTDKDHGADGIVGPFREKEASFYTIKEIWSPIYIERQLITPRWDGRLKVENRYAFTNTRQCVFSYSLAKVTSLTSLRTEQKTLTAPDIAPGEAGWLNLQLPADWQSYQFLYVTVTDPHGKELFTWSFELGTPDTVVKQLLPESVDEKVVSGTEGESYTLAVAGRKFAFSKADGKLLSVEVNGKTVPFNNGPVLINGNMKLDTVYAEGNKVMASYGAHPYRYSTQYRYVWTLLPSGVLQLDYVYRPSDRCTMAGITFDFPEQHIQGATLIANGPYRVYKNRMKGGAMGIWNKKYNNTITGESWDYPEFKGYYSSFYAMQLQCDTPFKVYCATPDVTLHLFTPEAQKQYMSFDSKQNKTLVDYPSGNISFMNAIPAVGTKFKNATDFGPQAQLNRYTGHDESTLVHGTLYFEF